MMNKSKHILKVAGLLLVTGVALADPGTWTSFSERGTVGNTRHNLTQWALDGSSPVANMMDWVRNDYNEVCVYCHTPHGANTNIKAPLWNRTIRATTYTLYNVQSLNGSVVQPGPNSLTCLSCHDGQTAVDSIVNMPGGGSTFYRVEQMDSQSNAFLNYWTKPARAVVEAGAHNALSDTGCLSCHNPNTEIGAQDFTVYRIGTDLSNDHPVGVALPVGPEWKAPDATRGSIRFFDANSNGRPNKEEVRFYDSGDGFKVECASCHDPHGVPGVASRFLPAFLRVTSEGSQICMTCHTK